MAKNDWLLALLGLGAVWLYLGKSQAASSGAADTGGTAPQTAAPFDWGSFFNANQAGSGGASAPASNPPAGAIALPSSGPQIRPVGNIQNPTPSQLAGVTSVGRTVVGNQQAYFPNPTRPANFSTPYGALYVAPPTPQTSTPKPVLSSGGAAISSTVKYPVYR